MEAEQEEVVEAVSLLLNSIEKGKKMVIGKYSKRRKVKPTPKETLLKLVRNAKRGSTILYDERDLVLKKCSICGKRRFDKFKEPIWRNDISLVNFFGRHSFQKFTICPECRGLPFNTILKKLMIKDFAQKTHLRNK